MTGPGVAGAVSMIETVLPVRKTLVKVGVEAAGHYHRPMLTAPWPPGWQVLELNPAHVTEQRRVQGRRRVKTDAIDLEAITELILTGRGCPVTNRSEVIGRLQAWAGHRTRRVATRTATKNQLLGQLDRSFPGLTLALPDVLGTKAWSRRRAGTDAAIAMADASRVTPRLAWHPALRPHSSPNDAR